MIKKKKTLVPEEIPEFQASIDSMPAEDRIFVDKSLEIARYVFQLMEEKGLKQKDLAERMGKSEAEISKILGGMHNVTLRTIAKLEAALSAMVVCTPATPFHVEMNSQVSITKHIVTKVVKNIPKDIKYDDASGIGKKDNNSDCDNLKSEAA